MENKETYLTKDVLGNLSLRVAKSLPCLKTIDDTSIWEKPIPLCQRIEANVREVDSVILEARKDNGYFQNRGTNPFNFQVLLARVYILLYYRHCDDELYKAVVFPELQNNMGIYGETLLDDIQGKVKKILEIDRLIEKSKQEKKKNVKPKYSIIDLRGGVADEYFSEFNHEMLFCNLSSILEAMKQDYFPLFDVASIWLTAKVVVQKLWQENFPENFIDRIFHKLSLTGGTGYVEQGASEAVLLCAYAMMRTVSKSDHFHKAIKYIENIPNSHNDYHLLRDTIRSMKELIDEKITCFNDYDYTGGIQKSERTFTKAEVERMMQSLNNRKEQLEKQNEEKDSQLKQQYEQLKNDNALLKTENEKLQNQAQPEKELIPPNAYEKIIFFTTVLSAAYDDRFTNQQALSEFICLICGGSPTTFQPRISKLSSMADNDKYDVEVLNAAKKIVTKLNAIPKGGDKDNPKIQEIIKSIKGEFNLK